MTARKTLLALALGLAGVVGAGLLRDEPVPSPRAAGELETDVWQGAFWRPAGSVAQRPALRLTRVAWTPHAPHALAHADTLASLRAVVRLAASD